MEINATTDLATFSRNNYSLYTFVTFPHVPIDNPRRMNPVATAIPQEDNYTGLDGLLFVRKST